MSNRLFQRRYQSVEMEPLGDSSDVSNQAWVQENLTSMQLKRSEMNELIMDYLVREGFKEAAETFREEAGIEMTDLRLGGALGSDMMDERIKIKQLIERGDILEAQSLINQHYPELLDSHGNLYFKLQQQHLIELIRQQRINDVLSYVHDHLSLEDSRDLSEMEKTLALLAYEDPDKSPYANLLKDARRLQLASEINEIIIQETIGGGEASKPRLVTLLKLLLWTQSELERKKIRFPKMTDLVNGIILEPRHG